jgi:hypothetical protein
MRPEKISKPKQTKWNVMKTANAFESNPSRQKWRDLFQSEKMWKPESSVA